MITREDADRLAGDNNFNILRLILATAVLVHHSFVLVCPNFFPQLNRGDVPVDAFFIISGYLITWSWLRKPIPHTFLWKRVLRIYPAFLVSAGLVGLVAAPAIFGFTPYFAALDLKRFLISAALLQYHGPPALVGDMYYQFNIAVWTIHLEFYCYLSVLLLGCLGILRHRKCILALFLGLCILSAAEPPALLKLYNLYLLPMPLAVPRMLVFFYAGSLAYLYHEYLVFPKWSIWLSVAACLAALPLDPRFGDPIWAVFGTYLVLFAGFAKIPLLDRFKHSSDISYGTYLYAWPIQFTWLFFYPGMGIVAHIILSTLGAYLCGFLSWHLIEKHLISRHRAMVNARG